MELLYMTSEENYQFLAYDAPHETKRMDTIRVTIQRRKEQVHHIHTHIHMYYCKTVLLIVK